MKKFTLRFDDEKLHQEFKIKCIRENSSMQQTLIKLVEKLVKEEKKQ
ncbi:hypothetical protein [Clostridium sp.]